MEDYTVRLTLIVEDDVKMDASIHSQGESLVVVGDDRVHTCQIEVFEDPETERTRSAEDGTSFGSDPLLGMSQDAEMGVGQKTDCIQEIEDDAGGKARDISVSTSGVEAEASDVRESNLDESNLPLSTESASSGKNISSAIGTEDESTLNASMSNKNGIIDVLEEIIADARNNKVSRTYIMFIMVTYLRKHWYNLKSILWLLKCFIWLSIRFVQ